MQRQRVLRVVPLLVLLLLVAAPLLVQAAGKKGKSEVVMKVGSKVHLFHSGNVAVQKEIAVGDVLPVYRMTPKEPEMKEVGQVKVTGFMGEHYFQADIVKGNVQVGDIAKKNKTALLVQPSW